MDDRGQLLRLVPLGATVPYVLMKVSRLVSSPIRNINVRTRSKQSSELISIFRNILSAVLDPRTSSDRRVNQLRLFFGDTNHALSTTESLKDRMAHVLGNDVYCALTTELLRPSGDNVIPCQTPKPSWPTKPSWKFAKSCMKRYYDGTKWEYPGCCAVCSRTRSNISLRNIELDGLDARLPPGFELLRLDSTDRHYDNPLFCFDHPGLRGLMLCRDGVITDGCTAASLSVCGPCLAALRSSSPTLPQHSLKNYMYVGTLPARFSDITWVEEQVCALARSTLYVYRLYGKENPQDSYFAKGNSCAHAQNTYTTASALPLLPSDINGTIGVVFTSSLSRMPKDILKSVFRVRKRVIEDFLQWLVENNHLYRDVEIKQSNLDLYPDDDMLPGIDERVVVNQVANPQQVFEEETSAFEPHPASSFYDRDKVDMADGENKSVHIESMGVFDADSRDPEKNPPRFLKASALRNLAPDQRPSHLALPRSSAPTPEYGNTDLFPRLFPTLYPYGVGGFDDPLRTAPIAFRNHVEHLLDINDSRFRTHRSFVFVALNLYQRRLSHLHTALAAKRSRWDKVATKLVGLSKEQLDRVAKYVEEETRKDQIPAEDKDAFTLLDEVQAINAKIPGSSSSKKQMRAEIRSYFGYFGLPQLYITMNPNASHSPIFQVIYGDKVVDLADRFPDLVESCKRRVRVASDPVAGEEFFEFSIRSFLEHLLGWDPDLRKSSPKGGIFGKLRAYYGTAEFTDRGQLHGHFLIWLDGGMNPKDIHEKMKADPAWQKQFFDFFEDVTQHHAPDLDFQMDPKFEPRTQRPPDPSSTMFDEEFDAEVKKCADILQKHSQPCHGVCFKYGAAECRFGFPQDIVPESRFDADTNSIELKCVDPWINWFNRYILVCCRHNHDVKCILSGKSAMGAMIYISDYITKDDEQMHQVLSIFGRAVAADPPGEADVNKSARQLIHRCLASLIRERKVHAQQAIRYLRGKGDSMSSHDTVPMLSYLIFDRLRKLCPMSSSEDIETKLERPDISSVDAVIDAEGSERPATPSEEEGDSDDEDDKDVEPDTLRDRIATDNVGELYRCNQVDDYECRDAKLHHLNFYDFVRCFVKIRKDDLQTPRAQARYSILAPHPQSSTHQLRQATNPRASHPDREVIPRVIGSKTPRRSSNEETYALFMLAHFIPFSASSPLDISAGVVETYRKAMEDDSSAATSSPHSRFSPRSRIIMDNWEAVYECEDERDAERIRKRQNLKKGDKLSRKTVLKSIPFELLQDLEAVNIVDSALHNLLDPTSAQLVASFAQAGWFVGNSGDRMEQTVTDAIVDHGHFERFKKKWDAQIKLASAERVRARRAALDPSIQENRDAPESSAVNLAEIMNRSGDDLEPESGLLVESSLGPQKTWDMTVADVISEYRLNERQRWCLGICAARFSRVLEDRGLASHLVCVTKAESQALSLPDKALRMLMTGPGGTGKTYVINALQSLMARFKCAHWLRYLAPTGNTAVNLPGGQTIHKGMGLSIRVDNSKRHSLNLTISLDKLMELRSEWKDIMFLLVDEISLVGADLLCELDVALRTIREVHDWFGGINIIFAGDLYQLPPVLSKPLFCPVTNALSPRTSETQAKERHGRIAWKQVDVVIELTEQKRMESDPVYASAVSRTRIHQNTAEDVALYNTRVMRTVHHPGGVDLTQPQYRDLLVIVETNKARIALNSEQARAKTRGADAPSLVACVAKHSFDRDEVPEAAHRVALGVHSPTLLPILELYIGAPVILKVS